MTSDKMENKIEQGEKERENKKLEKGEEKRGVSKIIRKWDY